MEEKKEREVMEENSGGQSNKKIRKNNKNNKDNKEQLAEREGRTMKNVTDTGQVVCKGIEETINEATAAEIVLLGESLPRTAEGTEQPKDIMDTTQCSQESEEKNAVVEEMLNEIEEEREASINATIWFQELDQEMPIIEIGINDLGHLCALNNSFDIPNHWKHQVRLVFLKYLKAGLEDSTTAEKAQQLQNLVKFKLLPLVLLGRSRKQMGGPQAKSLNKEIGRRVGLLMKDEWESFKVGDYERPDYAQENKMLSPQEVLKRKHNRVSKLVINGEISKAAQWLGRDEIRQEDKLSKQELLKKMAELHPKIDATLQSILTQEELEQVAQFKRKHEDRVAIDDKIFLRMKIFSKKLVKGGYLNMRYEHLNALMEHGKDIQSPKAREFTKEYIRYIEKMINVELPMEFYCIVATIQIAGIQKPRAVNKDIRPIGFNDIDRRVAFAYMTPMAVDDTRELFAEVHQVACEPAAMEKIIFRIRAGLEASPQHDVLDIDAKAAFQYMPRDVILFMVMKYIPWMFPIIKAIYGTATKAYTCVDREVYTFSAECGSTQGCVAAGLIYNLGAVKCLQEIIRRLRESQEQVEKPSLREGKLHEAEAFSYYDNTTIHAAEDQCVSVLHFLKDQGPRFGLHLNLNKCKVLLGVRQSLTSACNAKGMYSESFNIPIDNIQMHPVNAPNEEANYGLKLLGGFVGTDAFIGRQLQMKLDELEQQQQHIKNFKNEQSKFIILQRSFQLRVVHLMRTTPPALMAHFCNEFDFLKKDIISSIIYKEGFMVADDTWLQMMLKLDDGGLGLNPSLETAMAAYIAGMVAAFPFMPGTLKTELLQEPEKCQLYPKMIQTFTETVEAIEQYTLDQLHLAREYFFNADNYADKGMKLQANLQQKLYDQSLYQFETEVVPRMSNARKAIFTATRSMVASAWLIAIPHRQDLSMLADEFQSALCTRYNLDQPSILQNMRCPCKRNTMIDMKGHHISVGCAFTGKRTETHDNVKVTLYQIIRSAGHNARMEQFLSNDTADKSDITVPINPFGGERLEIDVLVTAVTPESGSLSSNKALQRGRAAEVGFRGKIAIYGGSPAAHNYQMLPYVVESHGLIHPTSLKLLEVLAHRTESVWRLRAKTIYDFWLKLLSVSLQRSVAQSILFRARTLTCHTEGRDNILPIDIDEVRTYNVT